MNHCLSLPANGLKLVILLVVLAIVVAKKNRAFTLKYEIKESHKTLPCGVETGNNLHPEFIRQILWAYTPKCLQLLSEYLVYNSYIPIGDFNA
jgi:hypothetical protein